MTPRQRQAYNLRTAGYSFRGIATSLGISDTAARTLVYNATRYFQPTGLIEEWKKESALACLDRQILHNLQVITHSLYARALQQAAQVVDDHPNPMTPKEFIRERLISTRGDDLERATFAFNGTNLDEPCGQSGRTRREILRDYQKDRDQFHAAIDWLDSLP